MPVNWEDTARCDDRLPCGENCLPAQGTPTRLDGLLPFDPLTGAVTESALSAYLQAMMEMTLRCTQPLALLCIAVDDNPMLATFRREDMGLVARAIMRCMQQETRIYDVIGRTDTTDAHGLPAFLLVCPLMTEAQATALAERMRAAMTAYAADAEQEWLTLSVGVTGQAIDVYTAEALIARAASALRRARREGNTITRHTDIVRQIQETQEGYADPDTQN